MVIVNVDMDGDVTVLQAIGRFEGYNDAVEYGRLLDQFEPGNPGDFWHVAPMESRRPAVTAHVQVADDGGSDG